MATIRGTFDLNSRPASSALRDLRTEGEKTDAVMQRVGSSLDGIGTTKQREQIRLYREEVKKLGTQWTQTAVRQGAAWDKMEQKTIAAVSKQAAAIDDLQGRVDELGRSSPTISVNTKGVSESIAEVDLLQRRLNSLGRSRSTAHVGVGGTTSSLAQTSAIRAASGGGGSFGGGGSLKLPFAGSIPYPLVAGALGAAPPLLGAIPPILGSAGSAALGAGALGLGGLGALGATVGSIATVAIPAVKGLKESYKALTAYNKAVATNGKNSTQAHTALEKLNAALQGATPGTRGLLNREQAFTGKLTRLTKPGQASFIGSLSNLLGAGNQLSPQLAGIANPLLAGVQNQSGRLGNFLTGGTTRSFLGASGATAIQVLPDVESTFQNVLATLMNISHAAMPFFRESLRWLEQWTGGWATSSGNIDKTRRSIGGMVSNLKSWGRLTSATFSLLKDLMKSGSGSGQSLVNDLTGQLEVWDKWIQKNPRQVRAFFSEAVTSTEKIAGALGKITGLIFKLGQMLTPLLTELSQFITFAANSGLLEPGMLPLLLAGGAGVRNLVGSARGRILGGAGGAAASTEGLIAGTALSSGGAAAAGRVGLRSRLGGFLSRMGSAGRVPIAGAGGTLAAEADAGLIGASRFSAARAAGYGASEIGGLARSAGGTFLRGAGARFLPVAALLGGLQFASFPGNFQERLQASASGLSAGLIPEPMTAAQRAEAGAAHARNIAIHYQNKYGSNLAGFSRQLAGLRRSRRHLLVPTSNPSLTQEIFGQNPITGTNTMHVSDENQKAAAAVQKEIEDAQAKRQAFALTRAGELGPQYQQAFGIRKQHGAVAALGNIKDEVLGQLDTQHLGRAGGRALAQNVLMWAREAKRQNPKLTRVYEEMVNEIQAKFQRMGQGIEVINGRIYTGSAREWKNIAASMANPIEQAREEMSESFTAIQRQAIGSLTAMGFSRQQAKQLVGESEKGGETGRIAKANMGAGPVLGGNAFTSPREKRESGYHGGPGMGVGTGGGRALGGRTGLGRIPGVGNKDTQRMADGGYGAPNELVVNAHTEARANQILGVFGQTLGGMVAGEKYRHSTPLGQMYARGGRQDPGSASSWRGIGPSGLHSGVRKVAEAVMGRFGGLSATSTTGGTHVSGSLHYLGEAVDIAGSVAEMHAASEWIKKSGLYHQLAEGIHNPNLSVSEGHFVDPSFYAAVWAEHANHIHLGVTHDVGKILGRTASRLGGGRAGGPGGRVNLRAPGSRQGGVPGALVNAGGAGYARGLEQKLNRAMRGRGGGGIPAGGGGSVPAQIFRVLAGHGLNKIGAAGIIGNAYAESTWNPGAVGSGGGGLWGFTASPNSLADLQSYAAAHGMSWKNVGLQTQFLLNHVPGSVISHVNSAKSAEEAAAIFMSEFERPGIPRQSVREEGARKALRMGYERGGRLGWGGWHRQGGSFTASRPTIFGVGEGLQKEDVQIRPHRPPGRLASPGGRRSGPVEVKFDGAHFHVRSDSDIQRIADEVGKRFAQVLSEDDGIDEKEVTG